MVGLDAAGKTTILYKLKLGEIVTTIPTIGMDICLLNDFVHVFVFLSVWIWIYLMVVSIQHPSSGLILNM